ncbi:MAG: BrnT family toxin [Parvularculaceae bacterium]
MDAADSRDETRYVAVGFIGERLHVMIWTPRRAAIRVIGLRKANDRERRLYEEAI